MTKDLVAFCAYEKDLLDREVIPTREDVWLAACVYARGVHLAECEHGRVIGNPFGCPACNLHQAKHCPRCSRQCGGCKDEREYRGGKYEGDCIAKKLRSFSTQQDEQLSQKGGK